MQESLVFTVPANATTGQPAVQVDVVLTLSSTQNSDGSYTVTAASGTYGSLQIVGLAPLNTDGSDNKIFLNGNPLVDFGGITFVTNGTPGAATGLGSTTGPVADVNFFYTATTTKPNNTYEVDTNSGAPVTGLSIEAACYRSGTHIRASRANAASDTLIFEDVPIENLLIGDRVLTLSGRSRPIKWIGRRSYAARFAISNPDVLPICFHADSLAEGVPARDLWVSPKHGMFLEGVLIPAEQLVNGVNVTKTRRAERVDYFHIELDTHDVILADGAPSETFVDDGARGMFQNADEYSELYSDTVSNPVGYAPRVEDGYELEAARRIIAGRAGLPVAPLVSLGPLRGSVEFTETALKGWAQNANFPDARVCLDILIDGQRFAQVSAERFRVDLLREGVGDGHHAFEVRLPPLAGAAHRICVQRSADSAILADCEMPQYAPKQELPMAI